jgi:hypothetical protein
MPGNQLTLFSRRSHPLPEGFAYHPDEGTGLTVGPHPIMDSVPESRGRDRSHECHHHAAIFDCYKQAGSHAMR